MITSTVSIKHQMAAMKNPFWNTYHHIPPGSHTRSLLCRNHTAKPHRDTLLKSWPSILISPYLLRFTLFSYHVNTRSGKNLLLNYHYYRFCRWVCQRSINLAVLTTTASGSSRIDFRFLSFSCGRLASQVLFSHVTTHASVLAFKKNFSHWEIDK